MRACGVRWLEGQEAAYGRGRAALGRRAFVSGRQPAGQQGDCSWHATCERLCAGAASLHHRTAQCTSACLQAANLPQKLPIKGCQLTCLWWRDTGWPEWPHRRRWRPRTGQTWWARPAECRAGRAMGKHLVAPARPTHLPCTACCLSAAAVPSRCAAHDLLGATQTSTCRRRALAPLRRPLLSPTRATSAWPLLSQPTIPRRLRRCSAHLRLHALDNLHLAPALLVLKVVNADQVGVSAIAGRAHQRQAVIAACQRRGGVLAGGHAVGGHGRG